MKLTTTLNRIRACSPCTSGWKTLLNHMGPEHDPDAPINLLTVLESNGVQDMLWCLRATEQDSKSAAIELAARFAESALSIFETKYPAYAAADAADAADAAYAAAYAAYAAIIRSVLTEE